VPTAALNLLLQLDATVEHTSLSTASDSANVSVSTSDGTSDSNKDSANRSYTHRSNSSRSNSSGKSSSSGTRSSSTFFQGNGRILRFSEPMISNPSKHGHDSAVGIDSMGKGTDSSVAAFWSNPSGHRIHTDHTFYPVYKHKSPSEHQSPSATDAHKFYVGVTLLACLSAYSIVFAYWPSKPSNNNETVPAAGTEGNMNASKIGAKERVQHWDVIRCMLELMVIFRHTASIFPQSEVAGAMHETYTPFMLPAFCFLSGVFGSSVTYDSISNMLCYTVGMTILYECCRMLIQWGCGDDWATATSMDIWELWYIGALAIWRLFVSTFFHAGSLLHIRRSVLWLVTLLIHTFYTFQQFHMYLCMTPTVKDLCIHLTHQAISAPGQPSYHQ